jgi:Flagellar basal-body P-ring protein
MVRRFIAFGVIALLTIMLATPVWAYGPRIKDVAKLQGVRSNQLVGYGLVVGLAGTGDSNKSTFTVQSVVNMLKTFGITVNAAQLQPKNVAAVMVTADLPPFVKPGDTIDITVSSLGDAKNLQGGMLLQTPLKAATGGVFAVAQGSLSVGGFSAGGPGASQQKNFPTVGRIPSGAIVERLAPTQFETDGNIILALDKPDFTTASRVAEAINRRFGPISRALDAGSVAVTVPGDYSADVVGFVAAVEELSVTPDSIAKVVVNERTGTVVMGGNVTIDTVAVAQGGLTVRIAQNSSVSQPAPLSGGSTVQTQTQTVDVKEQQAPLVVLPAASSVSDLVSALNAVGATPRDVITILQAIKAAGALHAELQLI